MKNQVWGNEYRTTVVCVDSYENGVPTGRFYNPYLKEGERFQSLTQFLRKMEQMLDGIALPQSFTAVRTFFPPPAVRWERPDSAESREGVLATFALQILFRQNASWQGSVTWLEEGREESFRSVLELIFLMDSALRGQ